MIFEYGKNEIEYLKNKCKKMAFVIDKVGIITREVNDDLFSSVVNNIVGQQISSKALSTVWKRFEQGLGVIDADSIINAGTDKLQSFGISYRKSEYILDFAKKVKNGDINLEHIRTLDDNEVVKELTKLKGIGVWTAEMLMLFCLGRKNVLSYNDFGIQKGLRMLYRHKKITKNIFEKYRRKFSPYCSIASLYLWAVAGGEISEIQDDRAK